VSAPGSSSGNVLAPRPAVGAAEAMPGDGDEEADGFGLAGEEKSPAASVSHMSSTASAFVPLPSIELDLDAKASAQDRVDSSRADGTESAARADAADAFFGWDSGGESEDDAERAECLDLAEGINCRLRSGIRATPGLSSADAIGAEAARLLSASGAPLPPSLQRHPAASREYSFERLGPASPCTGPIALRGRPTSARRSPRTASTSPGGGVARAAASAAEKVAGTEAFAKGVLQVAARPHMPIMKPLASPAVSPLKGRTFRRSPRLAGSECPLTPSNTSPRGFQGQRRLSGRRQQTATR